MFKLQGIKIPEGEGKVLEVHLDIFKTTPEFTEFLEILGFENDPFATFFPLGYIAHMTGRIKVDQHNVAATLTELNKLVVEIIQKALALECALYAEIEVVTNIERFDPATGTLSNQLEALAFTKSGKFGGAKADIHVEFPSGKVPSHVREYLSSKKFYWVSTPATNLCCAEEIATLQTTTYKSGEHVFNLLCAKPLLGCTAIHLEFKSSMVATNCHLEMPEVITVTW